MGLGVLGLGFGSFEEIRFDTTPTLSLHCMPEFLYQPFAAAAYLSGRILL